MRLGSLTLRGPSRRWTNKTLEKPSLGRQSRSHNRRLLFEPLESRRLLTTLFSVTNTSDSGEGSLREAILNANSAGDQVVIQFAIPASDPHFEDVDSVLLGGDADPDVFVIMPLTPLPGINNPAHPITLDGRTQAIWSGSDSNPFGPEIVLNGSQAGLSDGLTVGSSGNWVTGLNIQQFGRHGVFVWGSNNVLTQNYIGPDATGTAARGNQDCGLVVWGGSENQIGSTPDLRNVISGNINDGIRLDGGSADTWVLGNYVGTNAAGTGALPNGLDGIRVADARNTTLGAPNQGNLLSGNTWDGISTWGSVGVSVQGNFIGTDASGTAAVPNHGWGISVAGGSGYQIGGTAAGTGNLVSGNDQVGVMLRNGATQMTVQGNRIGTDVTGQVALGNLQAGVAIHDAPNNLIGGTTVGARNVISGNRDDGVQLSGYGATGNLVQGNYIGTDASGAAPLGNGGHGVVIINAPANTIGGGEAGAANVIGGNRAFGIFIWGGQYDHYPMYQSPATAGGVSHTYLVSPAASWYQNEAWAVALGGHLASINDQAEQDFINTTILADNAFPYDVFWIGATDEAQEGTFSWTSGEPFSYSNFGPGEPNNAGVTQQDHLTVNYPFTAGYGVRGSWDDDWGNVTRRGIIELPGLVDSATLGRVFGAEGNVIQGNFIGTNAESAATIGNAGSGVVVVSAENIVADNTISGNGWDGLQLSGPYAEGNEVRGNKIGVNAAGDAALPNAGSGIVVWYAPNNTVGGVTAEARNIISGNAAYGVGLYGLDATGNRVLGNFIGVAADGVARLGNGWDGVFLDVASDNFIGGSNPGEGNVISGNGIHGVFLRGNDLPLYHWSADAGGNGHYYVIARHYSTWEKARAIAQSAGGYLATVTSQGEQDFIDAKVLGGTWTQSLPLWIGLTDEGSDNEFHWVTGEPLVYTNWHPGQPETAGEAQRYAVINSSHWIDGAKGTWDDAFPANSYASLIEFDTEPSAAALASALTSSRNKVQGNTIGLDAAGVWAVPNGSTGLFVENAAANLVGGTVEGARNIISGNAGHGVEIYGPLATMNVVQGNYLGLDASGLQGRGNSWQGISILNAPGNIVGGTAPGAGNVVGGNGYSGVVVRGWAATGNQVLGNRIGTTAAPWAAAANGAYGVEIWDAARTTVGGAEPGAGNLISGNAGDGVYVHGGDVPVYAWPAASGGNGHYYLLTAATTWPAAEAAAVQLGGHLADINDAAERDFLNSSVTGQYNETFFIGLTDDRNEGEFRWTSGAPLTLTNWASGQPDNSGLGEDYVEINVLGTGLWNDVSAGAVRRSVIELLALPDASTLRTVLGASANVIQGNRIGTDASGSVAMANGGSGVVLADAANVLGGEDPGAGNLITGNRGDGVQLVGPHARGNLVQGNGIGTGVEGSGAAAFGNHGDGVRIMAGASVNAVIGNRIGSNQANGVTVVERPLSDIPFAVGNDPGRALDFGSSGSGVEIADSPTLHSDRQLTVAGWLKVNRFGPDNYWQSVIWKGNSPDCTTGCENREFSLWVGGRGFLHLTSTPVSQVGAGQLYLNTPDLLQPGEWHHFAAVIDADADRMQIYVDGQLQVQGPYEASGIRDTTGPLRFGRAAPWDAFLNGALDDVSLWNVALTGSQIQTLMQGPLDGNETGLVGYWDFNEPHGDTVFDKSGHDNSGLLPGWDTTGNRIQGNAIYDNVGLGIDLGRDGVTFNDLGDADVGPAELLNFPRLTYVWAGNSTRVVGTLHSVAGQTFTLDFYANQAADPSGFGEGQRYLGSLQVTTDNLGNASFDGSLPFATAGGERVTATATDAAGNTSEFSRATSAASDAGILLTSTQVGANQYRLDVFNATAGGVVGFIYGTRRGEYLLEPAGVTLGVSDPVFLAQVVTPLSGRVHALFRVPAAVAGQELWFQAFQQAPNPHGSQLVAAGASELVSSTPMEPLVTSISTAGEPVAYVGMVQFRVTFREPVDGVSAADFELVAGAGVSGPRIADIAGGGATYLVTIETGTGDGPLQLNLKDETAIAAATGIDLNLTRSGLFEGQAYALHTTRQDVNLDFAVTPEDALVLINWLNSQGNVKAPADLPESRALLYDVNEDRLVTPLDVLLVIEFLNLHSSSSGEGEAKGEGESVPGTASESAAVVESSWLSAVVQTGRAPSAGLSPASGPSGTSASDPWPWRAYPIAYQAGEEPPFSCSPARRFVPAQAFSSGWNAGGDELEDVLADLAVYVAGSL
jgi:hypothetical protein